LINWLGYYFASGSVAGYCDQRVCLSFCLSVCFCPLTYLKIHTSKFHQIFYKCYLLPWLGPHLTAVQYIMYFVLFITLCFHIMERVGQNQRQCICFIQFVRWWYRSDNRQHCSIKFTRWHQRVQWLPSLECISLLHSFWQNKLCVIAKTVLTEHHSRSKQCTFIVAGRIFPVVFCLQSVDSNICLISQCKEHFICMIRYFLLIILIFNCW